MPSLLPKASSTRRRFLLGTAGACAALGLGDWQLGRSGRDRLVRRTSHALGAAVTMTAWDHERAVAETALDAAFRELELVEAMMSIYRPESQLSLLNRAGVLDQPHPHLLTVLQFSQNIAKQTDGAFDVTVQPLWELYEGAKKQSRLPAEDEVLKARALVDWRQVKVTQDRIELLREGTAITLNGIAQGFAADAAMAAMRRCGVENALIDAGEMSARGGREDGSAWRVGIQHPREPESLISLAALRDRCLATSGDYRTWFSDDFANNHLFDPQTGHSPTQLSSVSIAAPTAMAADALSTAVFVLGVERGMELLKRMPDTDALLVLKSGRTVLTPGFPVAT